MAKNIKRTVLSEKSPRNRHIAWAEPKGNNLQLNIFNNGKWRPIAGGSSSTTVTKYTSDPNAPMLSKENFNNAMFETATKLGFDTNSKPIQEQKEQVFNELKSYKFATPKQGNAVLIDYDLDNSILTFQCDDGSIITFTSDHGDTFITGLRPDIDGYIIWQTTRDKLPVRESQEETDPGSPIGPKSVKSGLLGATSPIAPPIIEVVYTVMNNNTGEIVDPLELHKLTNVIWYVHDFNYCPFYLNIATDINNLPPVLQSMDLSELPISVWVRTNYGPSTFSYLGVFLCYDYTLKPNTMSKINTTENSDVSDINAFFN